MFRFDNNVGYASAIGLRSGIISATRAHDQQGVFEDSTFWNNIDGVDLSYTQHTILRDLTIVKTYPMASAGVSTGVGSIRTS